MLKVHFASLSLGASVDQQTGNMSVFELVEEVRTPQLPIQIQQLVISLSLEKSEPRAFDGRMLIHFLTPDGKQQMIGNGEMQVPADQKRMRAVFRYPAFPVMAYGNHRFVLSWIDQANQKVAESILDFEVIQVQQPTQEVAPGANPNSMQH